MVAYALEGAQWSSTQITWSFADYNYGADASTAFSSAVTGDYQSAIQWALAQWSSVTPLNFTQIADSSNPASAADIRIGFGDLDTASTGYIGHTEIKWDGNGDLLPDEVVRLEDPGQLPLISNGSGGYSYAGTTATLQQVALHEIGHALGLGHASDPNAVMYAVVGADNQTLDQTDVAGIESLYGAPVSTPTAAAAPFPTAVPSGSPQAPSGNTDVVTLNLSEDAWQGDAQFVVSLDGQQLGGVQTVTALHGLGQDETFTYQGTFGLGAHDIAISFINDAWGGTASTDRNLYVDSVAFDETASTQGSAALYWNSTAHVAVGGASQNATVGGGSDADGTPFGGFLPSA